VEQKHRHEQDAAKKSVRIQKRHQGSLKDPFRIDGDSLKNIGKSHSQQQRRQKTPAHQAIIPDLLPGRVLDLVAVFQRHPPEDEGEEDEHEGRVEPAEHHRIGGWEGRKGNASGGNQPDLVAVPERSHGLIEHLLLGLVLRQKRHERAHAQIEPIEHEIDRPQDSPQNEPDRLKHFQSLPLLQLPALAQALCGHR